ncbi:MAG TPA: DUF4157 domain-containing protein [Pyrinomonadaceae bacterium]|nr:DUF4157 domain-containing protein [Pyrinomonadaceae bacterium]
MAEATTTKSSKQAAESPHSRAPQGSQRLARGNDLAENLLNLQRSVGNRAVSELLQSNAESFPDNGRRSMASNFNTPTRARADTASRADLLSRAQAEAGERLDESVRVPMELALGMSLSGVRVHSGVSSQSAAESLGARAYTIGSDIYLGRDAPRLNSLQRNRLLSHEAVHTVQQGGRPVALQGKMAVSSPGDSAEVEADRIASAFGSSIRPSAALGLRAAIRVTPVVPSIQRDITGIKKWANGELKINFTKTDGKVPADTARETGTITFTPSATAPESDSIRFVQIARTTDKSSGTESDFKWTGSEAPRMKMMTARDSSKNIAGGFYVDQNAGSLSKRTKKSDPTVLPYYDVTGPPDPANKIGKRRGKTIVPAVLSDNPGGPPPGRFLFVTSVKAADTGCWYGTVLWGFELFLDKGGVEKIKGEYHSFRTWQGETTDEALKAFDEFYRNPGATTAPKK